MLTSLLSKLDIKLDLYPSLSINPNAFYFSILHIPTGSFLSLDKRPIVFYSSERAELIKDKLCDSTFILGSNKCSFNVQSMSGIEFSPDRKSEFEVVSITLEDINTEADNFYHFCK